MPAISLGTKRTCSSCGARFFDLGKVPAACPTCGTVQEADVPRLKSGQHKVFDKRKPSVYVHIEKSADAESEEVEDEKTDGDLPDEDGVDDPDEGLDEADGIIPRKIEN